MLHAGLVPERAGILHRLHHARAQLSSALAHDAHRLARLALKLVAELAACILQVLAQRGLDLVPLVAHGKPPDIYCAADRPGVAGPVSSSPSLPVPCGTKKESMA